MAEGQKKRQVGKGMKPRGNKRFKPQKETRAMAEKVTNEGQAHGTPEPVLEAEVRNETPGNLEPENGSESLQNLEQKEAIVAHDDDALEEPSEAGNDLLAALNESGEPQFTVKPIPGREFSNFGGPTEEELARSVYEDGKGDSETAMSIGIGTVKDLQPPCGGVPMGQMQPAIIYEASGGKEGLARVGPQPDGTTKVVVSIQEGYWDAVQQWAEADNVPVEQWLSDRLYEYVSTYGEPAKGR